MRAPPRRRAAHPASYLRRRARLGAGDTCRCTMVHGEEMRLSPSPLLPAAPGARFWVCGGGAAAALTPWPARARLAVILARVVHVVLDWARLARHPALAVLVGAGEALQAAHLARLRLVLAQPALCTLAGLCAEARAGEAGGREGRGLHHAGLGALGGCSNRARRASSEVSRPQSAVAAGGFSGSSGGGGPAQSSGTHWRRG